ncbi:MAG: serine/threonine-protein kinase, partial [bacterium]
MDADDKKPAKKRLGEYEIIRRISDGAQAAVYEARSLRDAESVAIKVFKDTCDDDSADMRFRREAELLKSMSHRNIVRYRDSFVVRGDWEERQNCLVMEYMQGETLKECFQRNPKGLCWRQARDIMEQTMAGLIYVREQHGIVHRDIKPSNIFVLADGQVRLFDFGIAKVGGEGTKTGGGTCMGSFDYMAPDFATADIGAKPGDEPFRGDDISDIFSLSMVFYEMLTGRPPWPRFGERPELEYLARWRTGTPKPHSRTPIAFRVIRHLTGFMDKGLHPDRVARFQTFSEMLEAFRALRPRVLKHKGVDDYELLDGLDKGGFGEVYRARRVRDDRIVAIKRLFTDRAPRRFIKEAELLRKYSHPNLVEYIDFFENANASGTRQLFIVMEYLEGMPQCSLRHRIMDAAGGLAVGEALLLFRYYLEALQYLHENVDQIIHRDIKPGNLYAPPGNPAKAKILDLGVARDVSGTATHGATPGTWDYMAPECVAANSRGTPQTDLYSIGLSLYEALTGVPAFPRTGATGHDAAADFVARAMCADKISVDFTHEVFRKNPAIEQIVRKSIARDPRQRFQSSTQMRGSIMRVLKDMGQIGSLDLDDSEVKEGGDATVGAEAATGATLFEKEPVEVHDWQTRVRSERKQRNVRRLVVAGCACLVVALTMWLVTSPGVCETGFAKAKINPAGPPAKPALVAVLHTNTSIKPMVSSAASAELADRYIEPDARRVEVVADPVRPAALPTPPRSLADERAASLRELLKDLHVLRIRSIVSSSYEAFLDDASSRLENIRLSISQPEYDGVRDDPEVKKEQDQLW